MKFLPAIAAIAAGALTAAATVESSSAATDTIFRYTTPKVGYFSIDPMSLAPNRPDASYTNDWPDGLVMNANGDQCFSTGVNLPQGAIVSKVQLSFASRPGTRPYAELRRKSLTTGQTANVGTKVLGVSSGARRTENMNVNTAIATINNSEFTYGFGICLETAGNKFYGARIMYTYQNAGD